MFQRQSRQSQSSRSRTGRSQSAPINQHEDLVTLVDGTTMLVPRANLAAAKELLAAEKATWRRLADARRAPAITTGEVFDTWDDRALASGDR